MFELAALERHSQKRAAPMQILLHGHHDTLVSLMSLAARLED